MNPRHAIPGALLLAVLALPASASALPAGAVYTGTVATPQAPQKTAPAYIRLSADPNKPADAGIYYLGKCADGTFAGNIFVYDKTDVIRGGKLRRSQKFDPIKTADGGSIVETATSRLTFTNSRVTGTFRVTGVKTNPDGSTVNCDTGAQRLSLRRGRSYGGVMSKTFMPLVITPGRTSARVSVRAEAACKPAGTLGRAITIRVPVDGRSFRESDDVSYTQANGTKVELDYTIRGTLGRTKSTGTMRVTATSTRADGTAGPTCDSGTLKFATRR